jgi:hypothetical protein
MLESLADCLTGRNMALITWDVLDQLGRSSPEIIGWDTSEDDKGGVGKSNLRP